MIENLFIKKLLQTRDSFELIPYSEEMIITDPHLLSKSLKLYLSLIEHARTACNFYLQREKLTIFDAHVGDTLCQIRAYLSLLLDNNPALMKVIKLEFDKLGQLTWHIKHLINLPHQNTQRFKKLKLKEYCTNKKIIIKINHLTILLFKLYFLSKYKKINPDGNFCINYSILINELNISKSIARKLIHVFQRDISNLSTKLIMNIHKERSSKTLNKSILHLIQHDDEERMVLPCYFVMKLLYNEIIKKQWPIVLYIHRVFLNYSYDLTLFFVYDKTISNYVYTNFSSFDNNNLKKFIVFEGESKVNACYLHEDKSYLKQLLILELEDIIFLNMASHPQYSGKKLDTYKEDPYSILFAEKKASLLDNLNLCFSYDEFLTHKHKATNFGCSRENSYLLFIRHIYSSYMSELFERINISATNNLTYKQTSII